jgi:O-antigen biosynthesis protein
MKFTGERFIPTEQGKIRLEHYHRYATIQDVVAGKVVLDVACGEGYGSAMLSQSAASVTGVDISAEAVRHAANTYHLRNNLRYLEGSATALPFDDASFDVVVSFETIEHLAEQEEMLAEIRRVLRPDGIVVISSPNRPVYTEESGEHNEFHVKELDFVEFDTLLKARFPAVKYFGQRIHMGSVIQSLGGGDNTYRAWRDDGRNVLPQTGAMTAPVYFVAVCGADQASLPVLPASLMLPDQLDLVKHYVSFAKWAQALDKEIAERNAVFQQQNQELAQSNAARQQLSQELVECNAMRQQLSQELEVCKAARQQLDQDLAERSRMVTRLAREVDSHPAAIELALNECRAQYKRDAAEQAALLAAQTARLAERDRTLELLDRRLAESIESHATALLRQEIDSRNAAISSLERARAELIQQCAELNDETVRRGEWALRLDAELHQASKALQALTQTNSWRVTKPLREARRWISAPHQQSKRYAKGSLRLAKRIYQALPLSHQTKAAHRRLLSSMMPRVLLASGSPASTIAARVLPPVPVVTEVPTADELLQAAAAIELPLSPQPVVSVIVPVYGQIGYTVRCLASIQKQLPGMPFEVIVVDDCSPDNSLEVLAQVRGIHLARNETNQGFIRACNAGAAIAKGQYLCFLNNDTEVAKDWLDELLRTFSAFPGTGLAGSKLVYPDGRLQEAGGIIWQDGSAWNFGRLQDPQLPEYNYAREVDYCSGASIMVPAALYRELGGFDEHYLPAYCEDSDLALKIRDRGYRVIYQPLSAIVHYEGITSGTDLKQGAKAYQVSNSKKLFERWQHRLAGYQPNGVDVDRAKDRASNRRVLVLDHCTPTPDQDAGSVTVFNTLMLLRETGFQVTFIAEDNFLYMPGYTTALQRIGVEVIYAPYCTSVEQHLREHGARYDLALLFRPVVVERHIKTVRKYCERAKVLYHTVDLHYLRMEREAELLSDEDKRKAAREMKEREFATIRAADVSIVHSTAELELLQPQLPDASICVFPLIMDVSGTEKTFAERSDIIFVGGYQHAPNVDAVQYFVNDIMPPLRKLLPGVRLHVVGSAPPPAVHALAAEDVIIAGFVEHLNPMLDKMRVSVAPLRYGAGIKGKIGTAMAAGLPVVATSLAAEGMSLVVGEHVLVADDAASFAASIARLYQDQELWNKLSRAGILFADQAWGAEAAWNIMACILQEVGFSAQRDKRRLVMYRPGM